MAKAYEIEGFDANNSLTDCLHLIFKKKTEELFFHYDKLLDDNDIEILHKTRVAARRLLALFKVFKPVFPKKKYNKIYDPLYNFKNMLGPVRENDVLLKMVGEYILEFTQQEVKAIMLFFAKIKNDNITAREKLYKNKDLKEFKNHKDKLLNFYDKYLSRPKKKIDTFDINLSFRENAILTFPNLYEKVNKYFDKVYKHPRNKLEMHRMRIKAKPIRYTMEYYLNAFGKDFKECYDDIKKFVETTGEIHDIDVITSHIDNYLKELKIFNGTQKKQKEKIPSKSLYEYLNFLKDKRSKNFDRINELLEEWKEQAFKIKLENSVASVNQIYTDIVLKNVEDIFKAN